MKYGGENVLPFRGQTEGLKVDRNGLLATLEHMLDMGGLYMYIMVYVSCLLMTRWMCKYYDALKLMFIIMSTFQYIHTQVS